MKHAQFGGPAYKPTRLFAIHMPTLTSRLREQELWVTPTAHLIGRDEAGAWNTAQAKEYPKRMSRALAESMLDAAISPPNSYHTCDLDECLRSLEPYRPQLPEKGSGIEYGADFVDNPLPVQHVTMTWTPPTVPSVSSFLFTARGAPGHGQQLPRT